MKKKIVIAKDSAGIFEDQYGIKCVDCPNCLNFIPNVEKGKVKCEKCEFEFLAVE